ncbi:MAG: 2-polyprenyl-6-methoxyphenol hydroxylase [Saprospiraceae bacterium]|nr:2-polyprenyl-6-methoxyphenol hydroxylase [Saprospiraceae bacterium]
MNRLFVIFLILAIASCTKDTEDPMDDAKDCSSTTATYSGDIKAIIDGNCATAGCHNGSTSLPVFDSFDGVFAKRSAIRSRVIAKTMPPSGKPDLSQAQIDMIDCWVQNGAAE